MSAYIWGIHEMIAGLPVRYLGLDDLFPVEAQAGHFDLLRSQLDDESMIQELHMRAKSDAGFMYQVNGIERFLAEDLVYVLPDISKTQLRKEARARAYALIQRGDVLRGMLESHFPNAIRLSVHPQATHGPKLGVRIFPAENAWVTPWHASALERSDGSFELVKRQDAEQMGAKVVYANDGRPSHFYVA